MPLIDWQIESNLKKKYKILNPKGIFQLGSQRNNWVQQIHVKHTHTKNGIDYHVYNCVLSKTCLPRAKIKSISHQSYLKIHTLFNLFQSYFFFHILHQLATAPSTGWILMIYKWKTLCCGRHKTVFLLAVRLCRLKFGRRQSQWPGDMTSLSKKFWKKLSSQSFPIWRSYMNFRW